MDSGWMAADAGQGWIRVANPFPVLDEAGNSYEIPFLGGFNVPRPQWADIDGDGDLDVFVQEQTDHLYFFERSDGPDGPRHTWRPEAFSDLRVGEWFRFVDVDTDGDRDLLAESPFSYMRMYRNVGTAGAPRFEIASDTVRDSNGDPIFSDRQNIPNAADIDCDGRLDLFIGRLVGTVTRYEALGDLATAPAPFRHVTDRFEDIEIVADPAAQLGRPVVPFQQPTRHGANTMALSDFDGDGDIDLFWGDFFEAGLLLIENIGSCELPNFRVFPAPFPPEDPIQTSGYNAPTFGDYDQDGDQDLLMGVIGGAYGANRTTADNLMLFTQDDQGRFSLETERFISQVDVGSESIPVVVDIDGDGDPDILLGNKIDPDELRSAKMFLFENQGTPRSPRFRLAGQFPLEGAYHNAPALGDLNGDGDPDMILGTWRHQLRLLWGKRAENGQLRFELADSAFVELTRGSNASPDLADIDGDGDLDLIVGESSGTLNFYLNNGSPSSPAFELVSDEYQGIDVGRRSFPRFADIDGDGDFDLLSGSEMNGILYFENQGSETVPEFVEQPSPFPAADNLPFFSTPVLADLDGDGVPELISGTAGGGIVYFRQAPPN